MNAAGGGTNKPKVVDNKVFAYGGGMIGMKRGSGFGSPVGNYPPDKDRKEEKPKSSGDGFITPSAGPTSAIKSSFVLALKDGIQGKLNTLTGKFTPKAFTEAERARYTQFGGKIPEKPKKPERSDFPIGRSGAKKYQEDHEKFQGIHRYRNPRNSKWTKEK